MIWEDKSEKGTSRERAGKRKRYTRYRDVGTLQGGTNFDHYTAARPSNHARCAATPEAMVAAAQKRLALSG